MIKKTIWSVFFYVVSITPVHAELYPVYSHSTTHPDYIGTYKLIHTTLVEVGSVANFIPRKGNDIVCVAHKSLTNEGIPFAACYKNSSVKIWPGETLAEAARRVHARTPSSEFNSTSGPQENHCIGLVAVNKDFGHINWWDTVDSPVGTCISMSASNERCTLSSSDLTLSHGTISLNNTEGHSVASSLDIQCTGNVTVQIKLVENEAWDFLPIRKDYISLTPSGKAYLTINGRSPGSNFNLPAGRSSLTIKDRLSGLNAAGIHYGSGTMIVEIL